MTNPLTQGLEPTHPGEILAEDILPAMKEGKAEIARLLNISRPTLYDLLNGKQAVTAAMALRLGKLLGNSPEFWMNLQTAYDLKVAGRTMVAELAAIPTLQVEA